MHVYFVRHGETLLNATHTHQSPGTPLSLQGKDQAESAGESLRAVNPDLLLSSEYTRALETARIIGAHVGLSPVTNGLFYEIVRPSKFFEKSLYSIETFWYSFLSCIHRNNTSWHYTDAENFSDISTRAKKALTHIESLSLTHQSIVIVSHTIFINIMVAYMCKNRMLDFKDLLRTFLQIEHMKNGSYIHVEYIGGQGAMTCAWRVVEEKT